MKETGITFADYSIRAIRAGRKTQTRRLARQLAGGGFQQRFGGVGDRLWCREAWRTEELEQSSVDGIRFRADGEFVPIADTQQAAELWIDAYDNGKHQNGWRSPIYMRRWMARTLLELDAEVRLERLQDLTEEDAIAELGLIDHPMEEMRQAMGEYFQGLQDDDGHTIEGRDPRLMFMWLWRASHPGPDSFWDSWASNPLVWRISFKKVGS